MRHLGKLADPRVQTSRNERDVAEDPHQEVHAVVVERDGRLELRVVAPGAATVLRPVRRRSECRP